MLLLLDNRYMHGGNDRRDHLPDAALKTNILVITDPSGCTTLHTASFPFCTNWFETDPSSAGLRRDSVTHVFPVCIVFSSGTLQVTKAKEPTAVIVYYTTHCLWCKYRFWVGISLCNPIDTLARGCGRHLDRSSQC